MPRDDRWNPGLIIKGVQNIPFETRRYSINDFLINPAISALKIVPKVSRRTSNYLVA
jgi:hypothetical protein